MWATQVIDVNSKALLGELIAPRVPLALTLNLLCAARE